MLQIYDGKKMTEMPKQSSAAPSFIFWESPAEKDRGSNTTLILRRTNHCKTLLQTSGIALQLSWKQFNTEFTEKNLTHQVIYLMRSHILHNITLPEETLVRRRFISMAVTGWHLWEILFYKAFLWLQCQGSSCALRKQEGKEMMFSTHDAPEAFGCE